MHTSTRTIMGLSILIAMLLPSIAQAEETDPLALQVANAYGFEHWDEVEEIRYTFNTQSGDKTNARVWIWRPIDRQVTLVSGGASDEPVTYDLDDINDDTPEALRKVDHRFINDSYWLLYPFQLVWSNPAITDEGMAALPIGDGEARKLITQYPDEGGYTPGDAYDLYLDDDGLIVQWVFRKGSGDKSKPMTWEANTDLGPIKVCTDHQNTDGTFHLWFSNLAVVTDKGTYLHEGRIQASRLMDIYLGFHGDNDIADVIENWPAVEATPDGFSGMSGKPIPSREDMAADGFRFHMFADTISQQIWVRRTGGIAGGETWFACPEVLGTRSCAFPELIR